MEEENNGENTTPLAELISKANHEHDSLMNALQRKRDSIGNFINDCLPEELNTEVGTMLSNLRSRYPMYADSIEESVTPIELLYSYQSALDELNAENKVGKLYDNYYALLHNIDSCISQELKDIDSSIALGSVDNPEVTSLNVVLDFIDNYENINAHYLGLSLVQFLYETKDLSPEERLEARAKNNILPSGLEEVFSNPSEQPEEIIGNHTLGDSMIYYLSTHTERSDSPFVSFEHYSDIERFVSNHRISTFLKSNQEFKSAIREACEVLQIEPAELGLEEMLKEYDISDIDELLSRNNEGPLDTTMHEEVKLGTIPEILSDDLSAPEAPESSDLSNTPETPESSDAPSNPSEPEM